VHSLDLNTIVADVATAIKQIDTRKPQAANARSGALYQPGIGPHPETLAVALIAAELPQAHPARYEGRLATAIRYPQSKQTCDLCIGKAPDWEWAIEIKMLRLMGDNAKPNDNMLMHILSPYAVHRSAVTDCPKLAASPSPRIRH
jgi:hypothetical protein